MTHTNQIPQGNDELLTFDNAYDMMDEAYAEDEARGNAKYPDRLTVGRALRYAYFYSTKSGKFCIDWLCVRGNVPYKNVFPYVDCEESESNLSIEELEMATDFEMLAMLEESTGIGMFELLTRIQKINIEAAFTAIMTEQNNNSQGR